MINTKELEIECINKTKWKGINSIGKLSNKKYEKGIQVSISENELINSYIIREEELEKWSIVITLYAN